MTIEEAIDILHKMSEDNFYGTHLQEACKMAVEALSKCALPSDLDEAAKDYQERIYDGEYSGHIKRYQDTFKAGPEWMAGQGVKLHGRILPGPRCNLYIESDCFDRGFGGLNYKFSDSNDVDMFVQIRKK